MNFEEYKKKSFAAAPELKREYDLLAPEYERIRQAIDAKIQRTQMQKQVSGNHREQVK